MKKLNYLTTPLKPRFYILAIFIFALVFSTGCGKNNQQVEKQEPVKTEAKTKKVTAASEISAGDYFDQAIRPFDALLNKYSSVVRRINSMTVWRPSFIESFLEYMDNDLKALQDLATKAADKISELPAYKGNTLLRDAALQYAEYLETFASDDLPDLMQQMQQYADYAKPETQEDRDALNETIGSINELLKRLSKESNEQDKLFGEAQKAFAKQHGITLLSGSRLIR
jgi:uncharacterized phage infection (PIP) family protein YhgE